MLSLAARSSEPPLVPYTVCEILHDLAAFDGKSMAVLGRYSFRQQEGRWVGEQSCEGSTPPLLWVEEDAAAGPKPPDDFELNADVLSHKLGEVRRHTTLGRFRFGSPDYDRWAVVYGRVEPRKGDSAKKALADLAIRGDGVVIFLNQ